MSREEVIMGVELAQKALHFAILSNGKVTAGECRKAIVTLFGEEVDAELDKTFVRGHNG